MRSVLIQKYLRSDLTESLPAALRRTRIGARCDVLAWARHDQNTNPSLLTRMARSRRVWN